MRENLKSQFPVQGWKQFLTSRKEILDAFDRAKQTRRNNVPRRYAVSLWQEA
jgi:hypothetical protein